jgi:hypothetical protein
MEQQEHSYMDAKCQGESTKPDYFFQGRATQRQHQPKKMTK